MFLLFAIEVRANSLAEMAAPITLDRGVLLQGISLPDKYDIHASFFSKGLAESGKVGKFTLDSSLIAGLPGGFALHMGIPLRGSLGQGIDVEKTSFGTGDIATTILFSPLKETTGGLIFLLGARLSIPSGKLESGHGEGGFVFLPFAVIEFGMFGTVLRANLGFVQKPFGTINTHKELLRQHHELLFGLGLNLTRKYDIVWGLEFFGETSLAHELEGAKRIRYWISGKFDYPVRRSRRLGLFTALGMGHRAIMVGLDFKGWFLGEKADILSIDDSFISDFVLPEDYDCYLGDEDCL